MEIAFVGCSWTLIETRKAVVAPMDPEMLRACIFRRDSGQKLATSQTDSWTVSHK